MLAEHRHPIPLTADIGHAEWNAHHRPGTSAGNSRVTQRRGNNPRPNTHPHKRAYHTAPDSLDRVSDENADKGGVAVKRCLIEARPAGMHPVAVTDLGDTVEEACSGALRKLASMLDTQLGKLSDSKGRVKGYTPTSWV